MTEQIGALIKEARTNAGMTQKALAEAVDGVSAESISKAERGLKELTDEQLQAIAEATGVDPEFFDVKEDEAPAAPEEAEETPAFDGESILNLFNAAGPAVKEAAMAVLKGETPQSKGLLDGILPAISGMLGANNGENPLAAIIGFLSSEEGKSFLDGLKGVLESFTSVFGGSGADGEGKADGRKTSDSFLAFTFFYTVAIYVLILVFFFLQERTDIKPED